MNKHLASDEEPAYDSMMMTSPSETHGTVAERHQFLSSVGHELRNPLTTIIAQVEILLEGVHGPLEKAQKNALSSVQDNARHMIHLLSDAIDLCKMEIEPPPLVPAACCMADICAQSMLQTQDLARSRSVQISCEISPEGLRVTTDARRLRQMITELLSSAVLTSSAGSRVVFIIDAGDLGLHLQARSSSVALPCTTQVIVGEGAVTHTPLLDRLKKLKPIGISLLQQLVWLQKGIFTVDEFAGQVVGLNIHLPVEILPPLEEANLNLKPLDAASPNEIALPPSQKKTILVADDQHALVTVVSTYFESLGFHVITARDGREAVELASAHHPDLIMMDVRMPVMDGLMALREIRSSDDPKLRDVTIISLSGIVGATDKDECMEAGATAYLNKPFGVRELDAIVKDHLCIARTRSEGTF